jgi:hypothetical protein
MVARQIPAGLNNAKNHAASEAVAASLCSVGAAFAALTTSGFPFLSAALIKKRGWF